MPVTTHAAVLLVQSTGRTAGSAYPSTTNSSSTQSKSPLANITTTKTQIRSYHIESFLSALLEAIFANALPDIRQLAKVLWIFASTPPGHSPVHPWTFANWRKSHSRSTILAKNSEILRQLYGFSSIPICFSCALTH